jgi:hypothetical protein
MDDWQTDPKALCASVLARTRELIAHSEAARKALHAQIDQTIRTISESMLLLNKSDSQQS